MADADQIPEQVYLDAAKAHVEVLFSHRPLLSDATLKQSKRLGFRAAVASAYRAGQAAASDGPRTWALPDEPGPEVAAVRNRSGGIWDRDGVGWRYRVSGNIPGVRGTWRRWDGLVITEGAGERVDDGVETRSGGSDG